MLRPPLLTALSKGVSIPGEGPDTKVKADHLRSKPPLYAVSQKVSFLSTAFVRN